MGQSSEGGRAALAGAKAAILGGQGAIGRMFGALLARAGASVTAVDRAGSDGGGSTEHLCADVGDPSPELQAVIAQSDVVVVALPESVAVECAGRILAGMKPEALWVDTLSVKGEICAILSERDSPRERLSINPMFAPSVGFRGQAVASVEMGSGPRSREFERLMTAEGASIERVTATEHDRITAATQVATHAAVLAFGIAIGELGGDVPRLWRVGTPPHKIMLALLARIANGNPEVYWDIQSFHPGAAQARAAIASALSRLDGVASAGSLEAFAEMMTSLRAAIGPMTSELTGLGNRLVAETRKPDPA